MRLFAFVLASAIAGCSADAAPPMAGGTLSAPRLAVVPAATQVGSALRAPKGIAVDQAGNVYVANNSNGTVAKISPPFSGPTHGRISTIETGVKLRAPTGIAVDAKGNVYVADGGANRVWKIVPGGVATQVGSGFLRPQGLAVNARGVVFVADYGNGVVDEVVPPFTGPSHGKIVALVSGSGTPLASGVALDRARDVWAVEAVPRPPKDEWTVALVTFERSAHVIQEYFERFDGATSVAVDPTCDRQRCRVYVAHAGPHEVDEFAPRGKPASIGIEFADPYGVAVDARGNLYVSDTASNAVWQIGTR